MNLYPNPKKAKYDERQAVAAAYEHNGKSNIKFTKPEVANGFLVVSALLIAGAVLWYASKEATSKIEEKFSL